MDILCSCKTSKGSIGHAQRCALSKSSVRKPNFEIFECAVFCTIVMSRHSSLSEDRHLRRESRRRSRSTLESKWETPQIVYLGRRRMLHLQMFHP